MRGGHHSSVKTMIHDFSLGAESTLESIDDISVVVDFVQALLGGLRQRVNVGYTFYDNNDPIGLTVRRILARPFTPAPPPEKAKLSLGQMQ